MSDSGDRQQRGLVFNIQHYSLHDGPGIRTSVFLKGCPLRCRWCSNPESQAVRPEIAFKESPCLTLDKCTRCLDACPHNAVIRKANALPDIQRELCGQCHFECANACPPRAMIVYGTSLTVDAVLTEVEKQGVFFNRSAGGMTLTGGEPLFQSDFAISLLREARRRHLQTAVETTGYVGWDTLEEAARHLTTIVYDLKHADCACHKAGTGMDNTLILKNFHQLATVFPHIPLIVRTPVIPGFNDTPESIAAIMNELERYPHVQYELLPYHRLGTQKYTFIGKACSMGEATLCAATLRSLQELTINRLGVRALVPKSKKTPVSRQASAEHFQS